MAAVPLSQSQTQVVHPPEKDNLLKDAIVENDENALVHQILNGIHMQAESVQKMLKDPTINDVNKETAIKMLQNLSKSIQVIRDEKDNYSTQIPEDQLNRISILVEDIKSVLDKSATKKPSSR